MPISPKEAVTAAMQFAVEVVGKEELEHLRTEEIRKSDEEDEWVVALSWVESARTMPGGLGALSQSGQIQKLPRVFKEFHIDAETGEVESMEIYE